MKAEEVVKVELSTDEAERLIHEIGRVADKSPDMAYDFPQLSNLREALTLLRKEEP